MPFIEIETASLSYLGYKNSVGLKKTLNWEVFQHSQEVFPGIPFKL